MDRTAQGAAPASVQLWPDPAETARLSAPGAVHGAALYYAEDLGLPVFPVNGKIPYPGTRGFKDATTDRKQIDAWWKQWPDAGVAAPTGLLYDVIDVDGPDGATSFEQLLEDAGGWNQLCPHILGEVTTVRGFHILIPPTGRPNGANIKPGVDIRGTGGYTVLPPSKRDGVLAYRWATQPAFHA